VFEYGDAGPARVNNQSEAAVHYRTAATGCPETEAAMSDQDRRVRRTRRILGDALVALILEKSYERITVQEILDRSDVGRSTFYAHYRDKEALLLAGFDDLAEELRRELTAGTLGEPLDQISPVVAMFEHAHRNRRVYEAMCGRQGGAVVQRHLHRLLGGLLRDHLRPHLGAAGSDLPVDVVAEFATSAALGLLTWWVNHDYPHSPTRLAEMYQRLAAPGLLTALGHDPLPNRRRSSSVKVASGSGRPRRS
jgi:AcrR family transcriptional regulator